MERKPFFSSFYQGTIVKPDDPDYWLKVKVEALYRYVDSLERDCSCFECKRRKEKLYLFIKEYILKIKTEEENKKGNPI